MVEKDNSITVTIRSFVPPYPPMEGYEVGKPFRIEVPKGITLGDLAERILSQNRDQMGIMAVNGHLARKDRVLSPGDRIDFYALIDGG